MAGKVKTIALTSYERIRPYEPGHNFKPGDPNSMERVWKVIQVTDSIEFNPGDVLLKQCVDGLCAARDWKVTVKEVK